MRDPLILFVGRCLRMFAYGALSLMLMIHLRGLGFGEAAVGALLTLTLAGDAAVSLWLSTHADRFGRRRTLLVGAALMAAGGAVFACSDEYWILTVAATLAVISPTGNEVGPFLAVEQAALTECVPADRRTATFAWYHLAGSLSTAAGSLGCGWLLQGLAEHAFAPDVAHSFVLWGYAGVGAVLAALSLLLSSRCEAPPREPTVAATGPRRLFGLGRSRGTVMRLSAVFALDAFAGGLVLQTVMVYWFHVRFDADLAQLGTLFFGANVLAGFSGPAAAVLARRIGLVNTMVFTHVPSNLLLMAVPFMPTFELAAAVLLARFAISQMDVPTRQSYTAAVVDPDERSAAAGVTTVARSASSSLSPSAASLLPVALTATGAPFLIAGALKLAYDGILFAMFRRIRPPEEKR